MQTTPDKYRIILAGIGLAAFLWICESLIHAVVFQEGTFVQQLFSLDLHEFWMHTITSVLIIVFSIYAQNIINRLMRVEEALRESEEKFRLLAASTPVGILLYHDDRIVYSNQAAEEGCGYSKDELRGMHPWDFIHPDYVDLIKERVQGRQEGEKTTNRYEFKIVTKNGEERWIELIGNSVMFNGRPAGIVSITDITDRKHFEDRLRKEGVSQIEQNMEQFQILNDQIRNPLQVIKGYVELDKGEFSDQINEQIQIIDNLVTQLDLGWLESEKVRSYLFRHYRHGAEIIPEQREGDVS